MDDTEPQTVEFGSLRPGDVLLGAHGEAVTVKTTYEPHIPARMYELELTDGTKIEASGNHLWYVEPDEDMLVHGERLRQARALLRIANDWEEEAETVALSDEHYEMAVDDFMEFFNFIADEDSRYFLLHRIAESIGHVVEEEVSYHDYLSDEQLDSPMERVYDACRFMQQALSLTGRRKHRRRWPVIPGRVVTTDDIFARYPDVEIPTPKL